MKKIIAAGIFILITGFVPGQTIHPGFSKSEYIELLKISARQVNMPWDQIKLPMPVGFIQVYRSPEIGLSNQWDLWVSENNTAVIGIRGTTKELNSWMANFYAVMVPAKGSLHIDNSYTFNYHLASDPKAAVHTGWLIATAVLVKDMLPKIDSLYLSGTKEIYIMGHSQGGAIAYLLTSHLIRLRLEKKLPADIVLKTYCSAAPKPGNLYYAYEFEAMTQDGWAYNVVNSVDWVPEMPVSIQTIKDYNDVNPFTNALPTIKKQKFFQRIVLKKVYKKLSNPPRKSQKEYQKILGENVYMFIKQQLPEFKKPKYFESSNYVRTGKTIVLIPDENYKKEFPDDISNIFVHHFFEPYLYLINLQDAHVSP